MNDYRGPFTGPGDEPPDVVPRTGPPTGPVAAPVRNPATLAEGPPPLEMGPAVEAEIRPEPAASPQADVRPEPPAEAELYAEVPALPPLDLPEPQLPASELDVADATPEPAVDPDSEPMPAVAGTELPMADLALGPVSTVAEAESRIEAPSLELPTPEPLPRVMPVAARTADFAFGSAFAAVPALRLERPAAAPAPQPQPPSLEPASSTPLFDGYGPAPSLAIAPIVAASIATASHPTLDGPAPPLSTAAPPSHSVWPRRLRRAVLMMMGLVVGYVVLVLALIVAYRWIDPPRSALMITTRLSGQPVLYAPVPLTSISSYLQRAVITSEDARFCQHGGVDWGALYEAMSESRGGSTITMQTAKNLFLWSSRSYVRKAIEIPVALTIDAFWPKRRILEVYLNIAEWGPGIFGAEAASYYHFDKPASRLTAHEATLLAATLPNPIARDAGDPGRITSVLASRLRGRMANSDAFVRCLGLRSMPRAETPAPARPAAKAPARQPAAADQKSWKTTTEPAFNPWQN